MNKKTIVSLVMAAIIVGGLIFLYTNSGSQQMPMGNEAAAIETPEVGAINTPAPTPAPVTQGAVKEFTVTGSNFSFSPTALTVKKGDQVKIIFKNVGGTHDFVIDEFSVATKRISGGAEDSVTFTADKTGTFEYYCSVGSHRAMGMKGQLIVTE